MNIVIEGVEYTLESLQADVDAARAKGFGRGYAFNLQTVQGLIDKINELSKPVFTKADLRDGDEIIYRHSGVTGRRFFDAYDGKIVDTARHVLSDIKFYGDDLLRDDQMFRALDIMKVILGDVVVFERK